MKVLTTSICNGGENETSCEENEQNSYTTDRRNATRTAAATATTTTSLKPKQKVPDTLQGSDRRLLSSGPICRPRAPGGTGSAFVLLSWRRGQWAGLGAGGGEAWSLEARGVLSPTWGRGGARVAWRGLCMDRPWPCHLRARCLSAVFCPSEGAMPPTWQGYL